MTTLVPGETDGPPGPPPPNPDGGGERDARIATFDAFWPFYLGQHSCRGCRLLHYLGTSSALTLALAAAFFGRPQWLLIGLLVGYGLAWLGHWLIEKNRPATFRYPLWSLLGDFKMLGQAIRQRRI